MQNLNVALVLHDCELRQHLRSSCHFWVSVYAHVKTAFAVNEADYPLRIELHKGLLN